MEALSPVAQRFILHWGEMGTRWGINRTVAQIHALLYLSPEPLSAEEVATTLSVARSNVSNSLKELQGWGVVRTVHELGDPVDGNAPEIREWAFRDNGSKAMLDCKGLQQDSSAERRAYAEDIAGML